MPEKAELWELDGQGTVRAVADSCWLQYLTREPGVMALFLTGPAHKSVQSSHRPETTALDPKEAAVSHFRALSECNKGVYLLFGANSMW